MLPLANSGAVWKEPRTAARSAQRVVLVEVSPGVYDFVPAGEATAYGGIAAELVETTPGSGIFDVVPVGAESDELARGAAVQIGTTVSTIL